MSDSEWTEINEFTEVVDQNKDENKSLIEKYSKMTLEQIAGGHRYTVLNVLLHN